MAGHADRRRCRPRSPLALLSPAGRDDRHALRRHPAHAARCRRCPPFDLDKMQAVLPDAIAFALLGAIESLLSAVVADGMTGRRHRSNCELVAQGFANIGSALFGGICVTGTIARTATNVRAGAHGPVSGMLHSVFLLVFMLVAAPLASYIPLAALAGVLAVVAWNMVEKHGLRHAAPLLARRRAGAARDLPAGRLPRPHRRHRRRLRARLDAVHRPHGQVDRRRDATRRLSADDRPTTPNGDRAAYDAGARDRSRHRRLPHLRRLLLRRGLDGRHRCSTASPTSARTSSSTARRAVPRFHGGQRHRGRGRKAERAGVRFFIAGASPQVRRMLFTTACGRRSAKYRKTSRGAVAEIKAIPPCAVRRRVGRAACAVSRIGRLAVPRHRLYRRHYSGPGCV